MADNNMNTGSKGGLMKGVVIGGLVGAAAGLLFAPKPGRELRSDLKTRYMDMQDKTKAVASDLAVKTQDMAKQVGQRATDIVDRTRSAVSAAKDEVQTWKAEQQQQQQNAETDTTKGFN